MESKIHFVAHKSIKINNKNKELKYILEKIISWIKIIYEYGSLFNNGDNIIYKNMILNNKICDEFTYELRLASLGKDYKKWEIEPFIYHNYGESWSFEKLVSVSNTGLVEWYCKKLKLTEKKYNIICENLDIKIIGAFYHRMKIILENVTKIIDFYSGKKIYDNFDIEKIHLLLNKNNLQIKNKEIYDLCIKIKNYDVETIIDKYLILEKITDCMQILLFAYIKKISNDDSIQY